MVDVFDKPRLSCKGCGEGAQSVPPRIHARMVNSVKSPQHGEGCIHTMHLVMARQLLDKEQLLDSVGDGVLQELAVVKAVCYKNDHVLKLLVSYARLGAVHIFQVQHLFE